MQPIAQTMEDVSAVTQRLLFERFELDTARFELRADGELVPIEPQVFALLIYLISQRHRVVSKDELFDELWGHHFVTEAALSTQLKTLRRVLGDSGSAQRVIKTIRGQGYRFVAAVNQSRVVESTPAPLTRLGNLGAQRLPLFGRDRDIERCITAVEAHRMLTLLGIGGTGKTVLAKAVARQMAPQFSDGVWFIDLVPVSDGAALDYAIANTLGLRLDASTPRQRLAEHLCERNALLIFDNCEHIDDDVARVMDHLLEFTHAPKFLMTSRDPLDLPDEHHLYLSPLSVDETHGSSPAVELFLSTAKRHGATHLAKDQQTISRICQQLDGLPLAIELAAAQLRHLSVDELSERLDRRFDVLSGRRRVGNRRQTNLQTVLNETWALLSERERMMLSQLAAFPADFTMPDAEALLGFVDHANSTSAMSRFVELSLISRTSASGANWRLLESVRLFALSQTDDAQRQRHALHHADWCLQQVGDDVLTHRHNFALARWVTAHYEDIGAAQDVLYDAGHIDKLATLTSGLALAMQLDEGLRAREQLDRVRKYLTTTQEPRLLSLLHAVAGVCGMILAQPDVLAEHAQAGLRCAQSMGEPKEIASQLILVSVRSSFTDPSLAIEQLDQAVALAAASDATELVEAANTFRAWRLAIEGQFAQARGYVEDIVEAHFEQRFDNLSFNAVCALIASLAVDYPDQALTWTDRLVEKRDAHLLWSAQLLMACIYAMHGRVEDSERLIEQVRQRHHQAGVHGLPDMLVPEALVARAQGDEATAKRLLGGIKMAKRPMQSFHLIAIYRQIK